MTTATPRSWPYYGTCPRCGKLCYMRHTDEVPRHQAPKGSPGQDDPFCCDGTHATAVEATQPPIRTIEICAQCGMDVVVRDGTLVKKCSEHTDAPVGWSR